MGLQRRSIISPFTDSTIKNILKNRFNSAEPFAQIDSGSQYCGLHDNQKQRDNKL